jgi:hypothetical protein
MLFLQAVVLQLQSYKLRSELAVALPLVFELSLKRADLQICLRKLQLCFNELVKQRVGLQLTKLALCDLQLLL